MMEEVKNLIWEIEVPVPSGNFENSKILNKLIPDLDLSDENFPHMSFKNAKIDNIYCLENKIIS